MIRFLLLALLWAIPALAQPQVVVGRVPPCVTNCTLGGATSLTGTVAIGTGLVSTFGNVTSTGQSGAQLNLSSSNIGLNTLSITNLCNGAGGNCFSAIAFNDYTQYERGAIGYTDAGSGTAWAGHMVLEASYFPYSASHAPAGITFLQTGFINGSNQQIAKGTWATDGTWTQHDNTGANQFVCGNGNTGGTSGCKFGSDTTAPAGVLDVAQLTASKGGAIFGNESLGGQGGNRTADAQLAPVVIGDSLNSFPFHLVMIKNTIVSIGMKVQGTSNVSADRRLDFVDRDNSSVIPLSISLSGGKSITVGSGGILYSGSSSGTLTIKAPAAAGSNTLTLPAGTTDLSATGGTSQVLKQTGAGAAITVAQLACADLSNAGTGCSAAVSSVLTGTTGSIGGALLAAGACSSGTVAVTNSTTAMAVSVTPVTYPGDGNYWMGYVSTNGTVTVKICAAVAGTPGASTYNVRVLQ